MNSSIVRKRMVQYVYEGIVQKKEEREERKRRKQERKKERKGREHENR